MNEKNKNCSSENHNQINAVIYCQECNIYMCNKCQNYHSELFKNHHLFNINKEINDIFTGFCTEENHNKKLKYFYKQHNKLCCEACISKLKDKENGQHTDYEICFIEDIKEEKKNKLSKNIEKLEKLCSSLEESIRELKLIFDKINENKETLKKEIQKIFTKIRNSINNREDELLLEVYKKFGIISANNDIIKESEKLPDKIKISLQKAKKIDKEWKENNLKSLINDSINIENNIKEINLIE